MTHTQMTSSDFPGYYISKPIKEMLDKAKEKVTKKDWDRVYIIDGTEGSGKSLLALQLAYYLDPTLSLDRVTFTGESFTESIQKAQKFQAIIFDEAFAGLSSSGAQSKLNKLIVETLMKCRQKNLFIFIVLPTIFLLQKYAAIFRSSTLFHVYTLKDGTRGYYKVYNSRNKKQLYLHGGKYYNYSYPYISKTQMFRGKYPLDQEAYRNKKWHDVSAKKEEEKFDKDTPRLAVLAKYLKETHKMTYVQQSKLMKEHNYYMDAELIGERVAKYIKNRDSIVA